MFDDDRSDVLSVIFFLHHFFDFADLFVDGLHGALGLPLYPVGEAVFADQLYPLVELPADVMVDQQVGDFIRDGVPDVVRHDRTMDLILSILRQELSEAGHPRRFRPVVRDPHHFHL